MTVADLTARRLAAALADEQARGRLPSLVAGLVRDGELVWSGTHGEATGGLLPTVNTQYRIGSITKTLTAVLVMQARDEGLLDLGDPIERHLPGVGYGDRTIRSLLSHSSGMQSEPEGPWWERNPGVPFEQLAAGIDDSHAAFPAGATYHYTNLAFALLGEVVARLRADTWWGQVKRRILTPLEMPRTSYLPEQPAASGYSVQPSAGTLDDEPAHDSLAMAPAGQLWSTVTDLARVANLLAGGRPDVLAAATLDEMSTPQSGSLFGAASGGYGLGLRLARGGSRMLIGHTGSMPGFVATLFVDRERRAGGIALANGTVGLRAEAFAIELLDSLEKMEPTVRPAWTPSADDVPAAVREVLGLWHWGNTAFTFVWNGNEVLVTQLASRAESHGFTLRPDGRLVGTSGYHHGETLEVVRGPSGGVDHLVCATFVYTRVPYGLTGPATP